MDFEKCIQILKNDILEEYYEHNNEGVNFNYYQYIISEYNMDKIKSVDIIISIINFNINAVLVSQEYTDNCDYTQFKEFICLNEDCIDNKIENMEYNLEIILRKIYKIREELSYSKIIDCFLPINEINKCEELHIARDFFTQSKNIDKCCVCYDMNSVKTCCDHFLCRECFNKMKNKCCPMCRSEI